MLMHLPGVCHVGSVDGLPPQVFASLEKLWAVKSESRKNWRKFEVTCSTFCKSVCKVSYISIMLANCRQNVAVLCIHIYCPYRSSSSKCFLVIEPPEHHEIVHILMMKKISQYWNVFLLFKDCGCLFSKMIAQTVHHSYLSALVKGKNMKFWLVLSSESFDKDNGSM